MQDEYIAPPPDAMRPTEARGLLIEQYGNACLCCGLTPSEDDRPLTVDHIIPVARGGQHRYGNYQLLCGPCNSKKGTTAIDYRTGFPIGMLSSDLPIIPMEERVRRARVLPAPTGPVVVFTDPVPAYAPVRPFWPLSHAQSCHSALLPSALDVAQIARLAQQNEQLKERTRIAEQQLRASQEDVRRVTHEKTLVEIRRDGLQWEADSALRGCRILLKVILVLLLILADVVYRCIF